MDEVLAGYPNNEYFFEVAGFYALQGETAKAIEALRQGIKMAIIGLQNFEISRG